MKYALVTGGSRGIGRACVQKLYSMGYEVLINYVSNEAAAQETLASIDGHGELLKFDVADANAVESCLKAWQEAHPDEYVEVLVNNAGIRRDNLLIWMEREDWRKQRPSRPNQLLGHQRRYDCRHQGPGAGSGP